MIKTIIIIALGLFALLAVAVTAVIWFFIHMAVQGMKENKRRNEKYHELRKKYGFKNKE